MLDRSFSVRRTHAWSPLRRTLCTMNSSLQQLNLITMNSSLQHPNLAMVELLMYSRRPPLVYERLL